MISFTAPDYLGNSGLSGYYCYAVNITGDGIDSQKPGPCDKSIGNFAGLVKPKKSVLIESTIGKNRTIEIYYVLSDKECSSFDPKNGLGATFGADRVFVVGKKENQDFDEPEESVEIQLEYQSSENSFQSLYSLPESCRKDKSNNSRLRLIQGRASAVTGNGTQVELRLVDKKMNVLEPSGADVTPLIRLGVSQ